MKIPKYVQELVKSNRLRQAPLDEQIEASGAGQGVYGYMFHIYLRNNSQTCGTFVNEVERVVAWARREYAGADVHYYRWFSTKEHRKPYYKRDYALVMITDPVAQQLEKLISEVSKGQ